MKLYLVICRDQDSYDQIGGIFLTKEKAEHALKARNAEGMFEILTLVLGENMIPEIIVVASDPNWALKSESLEAFRKAVVKAIAADNPFLSIVARNTFSPCT